MIPLSTKIKAALLVGVLDITAACTQYFIRTGKTPLNVLKFVASGVFGQKALTGGAAMELAGLLFHFLIAGTFAFFFFWIIPKLPFLRRNWLLAAILYGAFVWCLMNLIVLPLSNTPPLQRTASNIIQAMLILMVCIGLPLSLILHKSAHPSKQQMAF